MFEPIRKVFFELLQHRRAPAEDTALLARLRHNKDLCPRVQHRCEQVLAGLERHQSLVYDVQGPSDAGVDVVLRITVADEPRYIAFQIKSDVEAGSGVYEKLKAQWVDADSRYGDRLEDYYILLAWDESLRRDQIRNVERSFVGIPKVKVIEPGYVAYFLLRASAVQIAALSSTFLSSEDPLLLEAKGTAASWSGRQMALFVEILARSMEGDRPPTAEELTRSALVLRTYEETQPLWYFKGINLPAGLVAPVEELPPSRGDLFEFLDDDLAAIEDAVLVDKEERYLLGQGQDALLALSHELKARHRLSGAELREGLVELLSSLADFTAEDVVALLVDLFWSSDLSPAEAEELAAGILRLNFPHLGDRASKFGVLDFDPLNFLCWLEMSRKMMARFKYEEW